MRRLSERCFRASAARTVAEAAIITLLLLIGGTLAWAYASLPALYLALPLPAMLAAFRLHWLGHTFGEQLRREIIFAVLLTFVIGGIWLAISSLAIGLFAIPPEVFFTSLPLGVVLLGFLPGVVFIGTRVSLRAWLFWNQLRRRRFAWALTHAMLVTVALVSLLFMAVIFIQLRQDALPLIAAVVGAMLLIMAGTMLVLLPFFALFSYIFARHTTRRIDTLTAATSALRQGQYQTRVQVAGEDEIARLQADFNAMADDLEQTLHQLHTERDRVAQLMQAQRQLIASVSHELRTPVATIRSYLDASLQAFDETPPETSHALAPARLMAISPTTLQADLAVMQREAVRLQALIDDLFTLARAETQSLSFRCAPTDVGQLTRQIVATVAPVAWQRSRIEVVADIPPDLPDALLDGARWEQILHNLLHNAIRHTDPGGIIAVTAHGDPAHLIVQIRDTGSGIAAEDLPHIFERFYRGADASSIDGGSGLGLALVKELLEAMHGSIEVSSTPKVGSCFTLRVPYASSEALSR
jgi:signal transduction histidine kinase